MPQIEISHHTSDLVSEILRDLRYLECEAGPFADIVANDASKAGVDVVECALAALPPETIVVLPTRQTAQVGLDAISFMFCTVVESLHCGQAVGFQI